MAITGMAWLRVMSEHFTDGRLTPS
jgi:hypothetical protein